jgi:pSer/pThr/pTyr-binding forkhead associated (FHA) protein
MSSAEKGKSFFLSRKPVYIGRGDANDIVLKDEQVSHRHARFLREQNNFWVEDLVSTNGTYLNGTQIHGKEVLKDEDLIKIGTTILKFKSP